MVVDPDVLNFFVKFEDFVLELRDALSFADRSSIDVHFLFLDAALAVELSNHMSVYPSVRELPMKKCTAIAQTIRSPCLQVTWRCQELNFLRAESILCCSVLQSWF